MLPLKTKQARDQARQAWISDRTKEKYLDVETPNTGLTIWRGNAGNPYLNSGNPYLNYGISSV